VPAPMSRRQLRLAHLAYGGLALADPDGPDDAVPASEVDMIAVNGHRRLDVAVRLILPHGLARYTVQGV
jgi:hypothetical protein